MNPTPPFTVEVVGGGTARVVLGGELDLECEAAVAGAVAQVLDGDAGGLGELVLDLRAVTFIDSSGLRAVLRGRDDAEARGVRFFLAVDGAGPVTRLLEVAGVADWFRYA